MIQKPKSRNLHLSNDSFTMNWAPAKKNNFEDFFWAWPNLLVCQISSLAEAQNKFWTLFDLRELKFSNLSQNWAKSANLLFVILEILNAMDRHIEHCSSSFRHLNKFSVPTFTFAKCLNSYHPFLYVFSNHPNCGKQSHTVCIWILCEF